MPAPDHSLTIVTNGCGSPLLPRLAESINAAAVPDDVRVRWVCECHKWLPWGPHNHRLDSTLSAIPSGWVLIVSVDNIIHPDFVRRWKELREAHPNARVMQFSQARKGSVFRSGPNSLRNGHCDGGQFCFDVDYFRTFDFSYLQFGWEGGLFGHIYHHAPERFLCVDEVLTYYNAAT